MKISTAEENVTERAEVKKLAESHKKTPAQIILRWAIQQGLCIIPKTSKEERLKENADLFDWELSSEEMKIIDGFNANKRYCDSKVFCEMFYGQKVIAFA